MEKLQVIGHIGRDAVIREHNGRKAISFSVATNRSWKDAQGVKHEQTNWYGCTIWRDQGQSVEISKYLTKGTQVFVEGEPTINMFKTKDGKTAASIELTVRASEIKLLGSAPKKEEVNQQNIVEQVANAAPVFDDMDMIKPEDTFLS